MNQSDGLVLLTMHGILLYLTSEICCIHVDAEPGMGVDHADCVGHNLVAKGVLVQKNCCAYFLYVRKQGHDFVVGYKQVSIGIH